jgi:hypothetical protein
VTLQIRAAVLAAATLAGAAGLGSGTGAEASPVRGPAAGGIR